MYAAITCAQRAFDPTSTLESDQEARIPGFCWQIDYHDEYERLNDNLEITLRRINRDEDNKAKCSADQEELHAESTIHDNTADSSQAKKKALQTNM